MRTTRFKATPNIWPGFVDILSALLAVMLFALIIFVVGQFYLADALNAREKSLSTLRQTIQELSKTLGLEKKKKEALNAQLEKIRLEQSALSKTLSQEISQKAQADLQLEALKQEIINLKEQLQEVNRALKTSKQTVQEKEIQIDDLSARLKEALEEKVKELSAYRSEFFGKMKEALGKRDDIRIVGDRFVFQSEVLFKLGSDRLGKQGEETLIHLAKTLKEISSKIPPEIHWILRIDGHTDSLPINTPEFKSNWELSTARAVSVVKFLIGQGISPKNLTAAGFGEYYPIEDGKDPRSLSRNRRIELKLDQR